MRYLPVSAARLHVWLLRALLLLAIVLCAAGASAAAPSPEDRAKARALMDQGDAAFEAGSYEAALAAYRSADAIMNVPTTGIEVARTLDKLGRLLQARDVLQRVATAAARPDEPKAFAQARQQAQRRLSELEQRIPRVVLKVSGVAAETEVTLFVDGEALQGRKPGSSLELDPGTHRVAARAPGYSEASAELSISEGQLREVALALLPQTSADGPVSALPPVAAGSGQAAPDRAPEGRKSRVLLWTSLGVAAVGLGAGAVTGLKSISLTKDIEERCQGSACPPETSDDMDSAKTLATVSNVAFGVGVAALAVGVWQLFATSGESKPRARQEPHVRVAFGARAVSLQGAF